MHTEEDDNLYILEEEDDDTTPVNYAAYSDEERELSLKAEEKKEKGKSAAGLLFKIMFNPVEGWKSLRRSGKSVEAFQSGIFYPVLALLALSAFADYFYSVNVTLQQVITQAVVAFVAYFFGYFCVMIILSWLLPAEMKKRLEGQFGGLYISVGMTTLALFSIFIELLPMLWPILIFLPIWTLYLMYKGVRFFKFAQNQEMKFYVLAGAAVVGVPILLDWALSSIMPY